jgi:osmotically-inducible protein OsmY
MLPSYKCARFAIILAVGICTVCSLARAQQLTTNVVPADQSKSGSSAPGHPAERITHSSVSLQKDSASSVGYHHYNSDAERAHDDLLITEVKSALAEKGISEGYPVEVDADHGTVTLSGVVASAEQGKAAAKDAADIHGVVAVKNRLQPQRN